MEDGPRRMWGEKTHSALVCARHTGQAGKTVGRVRVGVRPLRTLAALRRPGGSHLVGFAGNALRSALFRCEGVHRALTARPQTISVSIAPGGTFGAIGGAVLVRRRPGNATSAFEKKPVAEITRVTRIAPCGLIIPCGRDHKDRTVRARHTLWKNSATFLRPAKKMCMEMIFGHGIRRHRTFCPAGRPDPSVTGPSAPRPDPLHLLGWITARVEAAKADSTTTLTLVRNESICALQWCTG